MKELTNMLHASFCRCVRQEFLIGTLLACGLGLSGPQTCGALAQQAYVKASNTGEFDEFGYAVAVSGDILVVGAPEEDSNATGVNGNANNDSADNAGAAYIYVRSGANWTLQAYLKASDSVQNWGFGTAVAVRGETVVVGAPGALTISPGNNSFGAVYVFTRSGTNWTEQARLRASNQGGSFGAAVSLWDDTLVVGALSESGASTGVNGVQTNYTAANSGAAYVFTRNGSTWTQQAYLKASNTGANDRFGGAVSVMDDTVVVGARDEASNAIGVNGNGANNSAPSSGAAYVFTRTGTNWTQQAYLKASRTRPFAQFGLSVAVSQDTIVVGQHRESSNATGVNGNEANNLAEESGAAYVFVRNAGVWTQQAYLKASNTEAGDRFGFAVAAEGDTVVVTAWREDSASPGVNGSQADNNAFNSGAAYVFARTGTNWSQSHYLKASNPGGGADEFEGGDSFGTSVSIGGGTIALGATGEDSGSMGVNGNQADESAEQAGAAYVFIPASISTGYSSTPAPGSSLDFGLIHNAVTATLFIGNVGQRPLLISSISFTPSAPDTNLLTGIDLYSCPTRLTCSVSLPYTIAASSSGGTLLVDLAWGADEGELGTLNGILRVVCDDPVAPVINYPVTGTHSTYAGQNIESTQLRLFAQQTFLARNTKSLAVLPQTATLVMDTNLEHTVTTEIPLHLGGGSVILSNFTGSFTITALPIPNDTNRAFLRVESGAFTAPSFTLPSGLESGLNVLTFGPPEQSSGLLNLTNGQYQVTATATITNQLIPQGVVVRGNYTGVYDFQNETANLVSDSADLFTPSGIMALTRSTNGLWLTWVNTNAVEHAASVTGPWQVLTNATSPHLVQPTNAQRFFRLATP